MEPGEQLAEPLAQLVVDDEYENKADLDKAEAAGALEGPTTCPGSVELASATKEQPALVLVDPALKAALLDGNRDTVLKLEETVKQFLEDSRSSLEFPPSTSNFQRLLEHKVAQHHHLSTTTAFENGQPRVVAKKPPTEALPAAQDLADIDISTMKIEPKVLIKRPPAQQQQQHQQHGNQLHQQRRKSHKEREQDYHEAREKLFGKNPLAAHSSSGKMNGPAAAAANGSSGNLASLAGNRQPSPSATAGASYMAAVPPSFGDRGFNIVNPGRGMGRGVSPGRGPHMPPTVAPSPATAAAGSRAHGVPPAPGAGPKAVYRDRERDVQDPDYRRGVDRYQQRFDPGFNVGAAQPGGMYMVPTYGSEFPSLPGAQQQYSQGAPPPSSSSKHSPGYQQQHQQYNKQQQQQQQRPNSNSGPGGPPPAPYQQQQDSSSNTVNGSSSSNRRPGPAVRPPPPPPGRTGSGNLNSASNGQQQQQGSGQQPQQQQQHQRNNPQVQQQEYAAPPGGGYGAMMAYPGYDPNAAAMYGGYGYPMPGGWNPAAAMAYQYPGYGAAGYGAGYMYPGYGYPQQGMQWQGQGGYGPQGQFGGQMEQQQGDYGGGGRDKGHARHHSSGSTGSAGAGSKGVKGQLKPGASAPAASAANGNAGGSGQQL